ncbi:relaxin receptor 2-like [Limulus polyphemus]|uniref:Relaxin receptor 2-like n=1 Tax=Limulus polyphemus TaxID=6850 RepID=A0ABM1TA56_LIMPO|nr:relaxin receptor 2-like [Limulus polyphemus]
MGSCWLISILCSVSLTGVHSHIIDKGSSHEVSTNPGITSDIESRSICDLHFFPCNVSHVCVEQRMNCDGKSDCPDGSDEWNCKDNARSQLWNEMFVKRPDADRESKITECELEKISSCRCSGKHVYCEHQDIHVVPTLSREVTVLDLSGNHFPSLEPSDFFELPKLVSLILVTSDIAVIETDVFRFLPVLRHVHLSGNNILELLPDTFISSSNLITLELSHNPLQNISSGAFRGLSSLEHLDLRHCKLTSFSPGIFDPLFSLEKLWLDGNELSKLEPHVFNKLHYLTILSLSWNKIHTLISTVFQGLSNLRFLNLAENKIKLLKNTSLGKLPALLHLDLAHNNMEVIEEEAFSGLADLESITLNGNSLRHLSSKTFKNLENLTHIYFDEFYMCSLAVKVRVCEPHDDGISSVAHLLDNVILRVSVWMIAFLACFGNIFVLICRALLREQNEAHSFYIVNLSVADFLMGVYLFIIAGHDVTYRGHYIRFDAQWRHSWKCNICGFLSTLSSEASVLILTIITTDRYISILYPVSVVENRRTIKSAAAYMFAVWSVAVLMSALPLSNIPYYGLEFYGNNGVCLPLHIHKPFSQAWEYSTFLFCGLNTLAFVFIAYAYVTMFFTISASKIGLRSTQQQQDKTIAKRFAFIVGTDFVCWIPVVVIKLAALSGIQIDKNLYAWVAVFLLPVNSALNPILYTLTTKIFKQRLSRFLHSFQSSRLFGTNVDNSGITASSLLRSRSPKHIMLAVYSENDHCYNSKSSVTSASRRHSTEERHPPASSKVRRECLQAVDKV